jgi:hypothetical protein
MVHGDTKLAEAPHSRADERADRLVQPDTTSPRISCHKKVASSSNSSTSCTVGHYANSPLASRGARNDEATAIEGVYRCQIPGFRSHQDRCTMTGFRDRPHQLVHWSSRSYMDKMG